MRQHFFQERRVGERRRGGFTLIEVMLVLMILVILASLAVGAFAPMRRKARIDAAKSQIGLMKTPLQVYEVAIGNLPTTTQGLEALRSAPSDIPNASKWDGPYLDIPVPLDPWGNPYQYACPGTHNPDGYDVWSFGPDGANGTADDIGNW
jgi:general secretion pathway protein G